MKILLVRPKPHKETIGLKHVMVCEPLELEYLISNIPHDLKDICSLEIADMILEKRRFKDILMKSSPDMVFFTGYITHVGIIKEMSTMVKKLLPHGITGVGGVHAEVVREDFNDPNIDLVFGRNGVQAFGQVLRGILANKSLTELKLDIDRISKDDLNFNLLFPDRKSVEKYRREYYYMFHNPCALVKTSYGCPYACSFCFCKEITKGKYYTRPMESVVEEIREITEEEIYIVDDDFLFGRDKLNEFIDLLKENNIHKKFLVYGRADFIAENRDILERLKGVGLRAVIVGIESIRERDLVDYNKKTSKEINEKCIKILRDLKIELYATMIIPLDFRASDFKELTLWLRNQKITFVNLQPLTPLPGTEIFYKYKDKLLYNRSDYHVFDMAHVVLKPEKMSVRMFYIRLLLAYYKVVIRPVNVIRLLKEYGISANLRMLSGSQMVSFQYLKKIVRG